MKFAQLETENSMRRICDHWLIPLDLCLGIRIFRLKKKPDAQLKFPIFKNKKHTVSLMWNARHIHYHSGAELFIPDLKFGMFDYFLLCENDAEFFEIGKLCILSAMGLIWERKGFVRLHAGFYLLESLGHVVYVQPGAGKSTWLSGLSKDPHIHVLADELCFLKNQTVFPVPLHLHLKPNRLVPLKITNVFEMERGEPLTKFFVLQRLSGQTSETEIQHLSLQESLNLYCQLIIGSGLHQMAAYHLKIHYLLHWARILFFRCQEFVILSRRLKIQKIKAPVTNKT